MLNEEEKSFIKYWEQNRLNQKKVFRQFLIGIPIGLLFAVPIVINFFSGWYKRADMDANSGQFNPVVLLVALLIIVAFTAIFYKRHQWDQYEQRYLELLARRTKEDVANVSQVVSGQAQDPSGTSEHPSNDPSVGSENP